MSALERAEAYGHTVTGIFCTSGKESALLAQAGYPVAGPEDKPHAYLALQEFDVLFSINNCHVLGAGALALPRIAAINYHNGPLPAYAGMRATAWAVLNGEPFHGITWHCMEPGIDAGAILVQRRFALAPEETTASLNTRCTAAAIESFHEVLTLLDQGLPAGHPQDLSKRTYFSRADTVPNGGVIDFHWSAERIVRLVRACTWGSTFNDFGHASVVLPDGRSYRVNTAEQTQRQGAAGTFLFMEGRHCTVACGSGAVELQLDQALSAPAYFHGILQRIAELAQANPQASAIEEDGSITLRGELARQAQSIAAWLLQRGLQRDDGVGIALAPGSNFVAAAWGAMLAGGAYVPLDPNSPPARRLVELSEAGITQIIGPDELLIIATRAGPAPSSFPEMGPHDCAYRIFTSGSTGRPKAVEVSHGNLANLADHYAQFLCMGQTDRVTMLSNPVYDASVAEIWPALAAGGTLLTGPPRILLDPHALIDWLADTHATCTFIATATAERMMDLPWPRELGLKTLITGGDTLHHHPARPLPFRFINAYGPTENTVMALWHVVETGYGPPPIGTPIHGVTAWLISASGEAVPAGEIGELVLGGAQVARGYRGRPELTAQKFREEPEDSGQGSGQRTYRTGDRARIDANGAFEFHGRIDNQVQVLGIRVEPGEVEAILRTDPRVVEAACIPERTSDVVTGLIVHVVALDPNPKLWPALEKDLRALLANHLPRALQPKAILVRDAMPRTVAGKTDRRALAATDIIGSLWKRLLAGADLTHDGESFWDLGGDSLRAMDLLLETERLTGVRVPIGQFLANSTLGGLRQAIAENSSATLGRPFAAPTRFNGVNPPLSFAQERLWFLHEFHREERALYNIPAVIRLKGHLDIAALTHALNQLIARHDALRSQFQNIEGSPVQTILPQITVTIPTLSSEEAHAQAAQPFDLAHAPLLRAALVPYGPGEWEFILTMHHIVSDGWSMGVIFRELSALYRGVALPPLEMQYADFAAAQRQGTALFNRDLAYWQRHLEGAGTPLELPADGPRGASVTYAGARRCFEWPAELGQRVIAFSRQQQVTPFITLLAVFEVLLNRYTGESDLVVGTPVANRSQGGTEPLIGLFVNMLPLRTRVSGAASFLDTLQRTRQTALDGYSHGEVPFQKLVELLQPERNLAQTVFFQVMFALQNAAPNLLDLDGVMASPTQYSFEWVKVDLTVNIESIEPTFTVSFDYNRDLFHADRMERMAGHFVSLLEDALMRPDCPIAQLSLLTEAEQRQFKEWNATEVPLPATSLLERLSQHTPGKTAVECEGQFLTYADLANVCAAPFPNSLTPVVVHRTINLIPKLLAIWKAGSAYVPIDPEYPPERQQFMQSDIAGEASGRPAANGLAYVIYTSGSSGNPKGVRVHHRSVLNLLETMRTAVPFHSNDVLIALATAAFDMSVPELWLPLYCGAKLVIGTREDARDSVRLRRLLESTGATVMQATPTLWAALLDTGWTPKPGFKLLVGAEALPQSLADRLVRLGCTVWNMYGPTETTIWSTMAQVTEGPVSIGRPIANTRLYVLDNQLQPVPVGNPGELYIAGEGVAEGYWNRPELTAEKFVTLPNDERAFRTGDLVRYRADGNLEFSGRADGQVKLHGYRIELGEIEAVLEQHPSIDRAVAVIREDQPGNKYLAAYFTGIVVSEIELTALLEAKLPPYMMPASFTWLTSLPLSANGKVDRRALPAPVAPLGLAPAVPASTLQELLQTIFANVLQVESIAADDNFFRMGGHSLLATRAIARIQNAFGKELPLRSLFESPTPRALAQRIAQSSRSTLPRIASYGEVATVPLSFAQTRLLFLDRYYGGLSSLYNIAEAFTIRGPLDRDRFLACIVQITHRHTALRTRFLEDSGLVDRQAVLTWTNRPHDAPFDLANECPIRIGLQEQSAAQWRFTLTLHHIAADGWSFAIFYRELEALYAGEALAPLPLQYSDFAQWQNHVLTSERLHADITWWRAQLSGAPELLNLPSDRTRPPEQSLEAGNYQFAFPAELTLSLRQLARAEDATLFIVLLAGFQTLLARYTQTDDIVVGSAIANRTFTEVEPLIGFFANTLVLRTRLDGEPDFREAVRRAREVLLDAVAHGDLPLEKLVEAIDLERTDAYTPLFQVMFLFQNNVGGELALPGLQVERVPLPFSTARFDLTLEISEKRGELHAHFNYTAALFDADRMERMAGHFVQLLQAAVRAPETPVSKLPLLTAGELTQFGIWNQTELDLPASNFVDVFRAHAARQPESVAIQWEDQLLTYSQLDRASDIFPGIAHHALVPVTVERNADLIPHLLAIWKANSAYVPIDPEYPVERQQFMRNDIADEASGHPAANGLAYVMYTSGSSGNPKGVRVHHRSVLNLLETMRTAVPFHSNDVLIALATAAFDMSVPELWLPLYCGAKLVIGTREDARDSVRLRRLLESTGATVMQATPTLWAALLDTGWTPKPGFKLLVGAEALPQSLADRLVRLGCTVWNMYGPTETTIWSTMAQVTEGPVSIGRPIANTRLYVLDNQLQPVPVGNPGELYIAGEGVAEGYWNRPELTAEKFVTLPNDERAFRTGDLVRYRADGNLEFSGRADGQVKLHGYRIELGEIEAALEQHPNLDRAVAVIREDISGNKYLAAYFTGHPVTDLELTQLLQTKLPDYMIPSRFTWLETLPLSSNGKIDRRALLLLSAPLPLQARAPASTEEELLQVIFAHVLRVEFISPEDSFFRMGGHSLLATRAIARIRDVFHVELPLRSLFEAPTPRALALKMAQLVAKPAPPIEARTTQELVPLSFAQARQWFLDRYHGGTSPMYNIAEAFRLRGQVNAPRLLAALTEITRRHTVLRTRFADGDATIDSPRSLTWSDKPPFAPFDLLHDWPLRVSLTERTPEEWELGIVLHHIASDAWSSTLLYRELRELYCGETLPPLAIQYSDFAQWQREWLTGERLAELSDWWKTQLDGAPPLLTLPADRSRPAEQEFAAGNIAFVIPAHLTAALHRFARDEDATLFMVLLAGLQVLLARYTQTDDIVVGSPVANRGMTETEPLIGLFVNTLVLRTKLDGEPDFREAVRRAREVSLDAAAHQDLPFEKVVEAIAPARTGAYTPLFQIFLILQNHEMGELTLPDIEIERIPLPLTTARFDLTIAFEERDGELHGLLNFSAALFDAVRMERMAEHLAKLLTAAIAEPDKPITQLPLLTGAERLQLEMWNRTERAVSEISSYAERFLAQAQRTPDAVAVECQGQQLTYSQLERKARQLSVSHTSGSLIPVVAHRTIELLPQLLAIWMAGSAYVPLDPDYPAERLLFIEQDLATGAPLSDIAYVIYTSGSTGQPKGVAITHGAMLNLLDDVRERISFTPADTLLAVTTAGFDISILEFWMPLLTGSRVVIASREEVRDPHQLRRLAERSGATVMQATPAGWTLLLDAGWRAPEGFRILVGGEALPPSLAKRLIALGCPVWNMFGPTETTIWSTMSRVSGEAIAIGRPLANTRVYVLDGNRELLPIGIPGELYIAGAGLAWGYWNRPELTAERFVTLPWGERAYRTGDSVQFRDDGELEFLQRLDTQVKLRGFRIELGDVESTLTLHPLVTAAAAAIRDESLLVWYTGSATETELRAHAARKLPGYMVPSRFFAVEELPVNVHGKLDRNALTVPAPKQSLSDSIPLTPLEQRLLPLWRDSLASPNLSVTDSFFDYGGHSLSAMRLILSMEQETGQPIPFQTLFTAPTVREIAQYLERNAAAYELPAGLIGIQPNGMGRPIFFFNVRAGCWNLAHALGPDQPLLGVEPEADSITAIRARQPQGPYLLAASETGEKAALSTASALIAAGETVTAVVLLDSALPKAHRLWDRLIRRAAVSSSYSGTIVHFRSSELASPVFESPAIEQISSELLRLRHS